MMELYVYNKYNDDLKSWKLNRTKVIRVVVVVLIVLIVVAAAHSFAHFCKLFDTVFSHFVLAFTPLKSFFFFLIKFLQVMHNCAQWWFGCIETMITIATKLTKV